MSEKELPHDIGKSRIPSGLQQALDKLGSTPRCAATPTLQEETSELSDNQDNMPHRHRPRQNEHRYPGGSNSRGTQSRQTKRQDAFNQNTMDQGNTNRSPSQQGRIEYGAMNPGSHNKSTVNQGTSNQNPSHQRKTTHGSTSQSSFNNPDMFQHGHPTIQPPLNQTTWLVHAPKPDMTDHPPPSSTAIHLSHHAELQRQLVTMQQQISRQPGISSIVANSINGQLRHIAKAYNDKQMELVRELHAATIERDQARQAIMAAQRQIAMIQNERDAAIRERDRLLAEINTIHDRQRSTEDRISRMETQFRTLNQDLEAKVKLQEEQLSGKRSIWLENHPNSNARKTVGKDRDDIFTTPTGKGGGGNLFTQPSPPSPLITPGGGTCNFPPFVNQLGPSQAWDVPLHQPRPSGGSTGRPPVPYYPLPTGGGQPGAVPYTHANLNQSNLTAGSRAEAGTRQSTGPVDRARADYLEPPASQALTLFVPEEEVSKDFSDKMTKVIRLIEKWVQTFADKPNEKDQKLPNDHASLWQYILGLTYRNLQDAHTHAMHLLKDPKLRMFFVMRMVVDYIVRNMWSAAAFLGFDEKTEKELRACKKGLQEKGLTVQERQTFVTRQSNCVQCIIDSDRYQGFRVERLHYHTKKLRDMLGVLLNDGVKRSEAGAGISAIASSSWDITAKMYTSHLSFQIVFPDAGGKFNASTMISRDIKQNEAPLSLQIRQVRLKLVITPVITMRDDRGHSIIAKNLQCAHVLTMR